MLFTDVKEICRSFNCIYFTISFSGVEYVDILETVLHPPVRAMVYLEEEPILLVNSPKHKKMVFAEWLSKHPEILALWWTSKTPELNHSQTLRAQMVNEWMGTCVTTFLSVMGYAQKVCESLRRNSSYFEHLVDSMPDRQPAVRAPRGNTPSTNAGNQNDITLFGPRNIRVSLFIRLFTHVYPFCPLQLFNLCYLIFAFRIFNNQTDSDQLEENLNAIAFTYVEILLLKVNYLRIFCSCIYIW